MKFKLITYNIWHGKHFEKVATFLQNEGAEIVCTQEMATKGRDFGHEDIDLLRELETRLHMPGIYERMAWGDNGRGKYDIGVAIFNKYKILDRVTYYYEQEQTQTLVNTQKDRYMIPRVLLGLKLAIGEDTIWVFTTHFTITPAITPTPHQLTNAHRIKDFLSPYEEYILCGDLNTGYQTQTYEILKEGCVDVSSPELPTLHPTIHRVGYLKPHVDYVFVKSKKLKAISSRVPVVDGSDHLPVVVEFESE